MLKFLSLLSTVKPVIRVPQEEILVNNGETALLRCEASGLPAPIITWYKGEEEVKNQASYY